MSHDPYLQKRFVHAPSFVSSQVVDEVVLVSLREGAAITESYSLNAVGGRIWELIDGQRRVQDIRDVIAGEFEVGVPQAETDLCSLLQQLEHIGAIVEV